MLQRLRRRRPLTGVDGQQRGQEGGAAFVRRRHPRLEAGAFWPQDVVQALQTDQCALAQYESTLSISTGSSGCVMD